MKILQSIYEAKDKQKLSNTKRVYCPPGKGKTNKMDFSQYWKHQKHKHFDLTPRLKARIRNAKGFWSLTKDDSSEKIHIKKDLDEK